MNAPVGPPIWTLLPPSAEIRKPATIAVTSPASGGAPEAIAIAMLSGIATSATLIPANRSPTNSRDVYSGSVVSSLGFMRRSGLAQQLERHSIGHDAITLQRRVQAVARIERR